ncbi:MAG: transcriptional repressor LexA [Alphaproteobacteria bacterium]|nr:transcriptional repressor LexA [Alphaproteobacteria bacterium]
MLTKKQRDLLLFIHERMKDDDVAPSFEEMKQALKLKSKSGIHRLITALVERGYIERLPHRARALEIKRLPETMGKQTASAARAVRNPTPFENIGSGSFALNIIPVFGKIAAGTPIEAIQDDGHTVALPPGFVGAGDHFALRVEGDSMVNAGIQDDDLVIIKRCDSAENGAIVVALVDEREATLKRLQRKSGTIILQPENDAYKPQVLEPKRVRIQGKLVSLLRHYN